MINLELNMHDAVVLRHALFMYTKDHPEFFNCDKIKIIRQISNELDIEIGREFDMQQSENTKEEDL